jgi:hypothetical protein
LTWYVSTLSELCLLPVYEDSCVKINREKRLLVKSHVFKRVTDDY